MCIEKTYLYIIKTVYDNPIANYMFNDKMLKAFPLREQDTVLTLISLEYWSIGEDVEKMEHLCPVAGNISWYRHYGIFYVDSSKKKKTYHKIQQFHS